MLSDPKNSHKSNNIGTKQIKIHDLTPLIVVVNVLLHKPFRVTFNGPVNMRILYIGLISISSMEALSNLIGSKSLIC